MNLEIHNIYTQINNFPKDKELKKRIRLELSYTTDEYFRGKMHTIKKTLFLSRQNIFPTGMLRIAIDFLDKNGIDYDIEDKRQKIEILTPLKLHNVKLRDYQRKVVKLSVKRARGIIEVATGGGKTVISAAIIGKINLPTIFCVHTGDLLQQAYDTFTRVLQVPIGRVGAGYCDIQDINVCMVQTLNSCLGKKYIPIDELDKYVEDPKVLQKKKDILEMLERTKVILIDECQHMAAQTYVNLMEATPNCYWKLGLSGTPFRNSGEDVLLQAYAGKPICKINASFLIKRGYLCKPTIYMINPLKNKKLIYSKEMYQKVYKEHVVESERRNNVIVAYAKYLFEKGHRTLILVNQIKHGNIIVEKLKEEIDTQIEFLTGEVNLELRTSLLNKMRNDELKIIVGTTLCDEGLDVPIVDGLILGGAGKSNVRIPQRIGRTLRLHPDKKDPIIIDMYDNVKFLLGQTKERIRIYKKEPEFKVIHKY